MTISEPQAASQELPPVNLVTSTRVRDDRQAEIAAWQQRMSAAIAQFPGFVDQQVLAADPPIQPDWVIIQRFEHRAQAQAWLQSAERAELLEEADDLLVGDDSINLFDEPQQPGRSAVMAVIRTHVDPEWNEQFRAWHQRINAVQRQFPGFLGCKLQEPIDGVQEEWNTLLAFDTPEHLEAWLGSPQREELLAEARDMMKSTRMRTVKSGFQEWFEFGTDSSPIPPWKFNYLILMGLYPIVMLQLLFLNPLLAWMEMPFTTLLGNIMSVALLGWPTVVLISKAMSWWTTPRGAPSARRDIAGVVVLVAVMSALVGFFWFLHQTVTITPITSL